MVRSYSTAFAHFVNQLALPWRKSQRDNLVLFGAAFLASRCLAVRRLSRALAGPAWRPLKATDKRLRRFLGNERLHLDQALRAYLTFLLPRFSTVPFIPLMLDWTYVGEWAILSLKIPYRGRSLPLFETVHERSIEKRVYSQTQAEVSLLRRVRWCWPESAPPPLILADRGFDKSRLIEWLLHGTCGKKRDQRHPSAPGSHPWLFVIRSCMQAAITDRRGRRLEKRLRLYPGETLFYPNVTYHLEGQFCVHLVARCIIDPKTNKPATWYLITNLPEERLKQVPHLYAQRMQPEETYRDSKRGHLLDGFGLHRMRRLRRDRLERLLFVFGLVYGFLVLVAETEQQTRAELMRRYWRLSLVRFALDLLQHAPTRAPSRARQACASVRLEPLWLQTGDS
jgi:hypothetical protein